MKFLSKYLDDFLLVAGSAVLIYGIWLIWVPGALMAAGIVLIAFSILVAHGGKS